MDKEFNTFPDAGRPDHPLPSLVGMDGQIIGYLTGPGQSEIRWCHGCWEAHRKEVALEAKVRQLEMENCHLQCNLAEITSTKEACEDRLVKLFVNVQQAIRCNHCDDSPLQPISLGCGHSFCGGCYEGTSCDPEKDIHKLRCPLGSCQQARHDAGTQQARSVALQRLLEILAHEAKEDDWLEEYGFGLGLYYRSKTRRERRQLENQRR